MTHAPAWRCRDAGDEPGHRLLASLGGFTLDELGCLFLGRASDLTDHDDRVRVRIGEEHLEHVDELGPLHGIAADADGRRLAEASIRGLLHGLIGERARARYDANVPALEDVAGHDADLAFVRSKHAGAVGADEPRGRPFQRPLHLHHVHHRNALRNAHDERDFSVDCFENGIGRERRRHIVRSGGRAGLLLGLRYRIEKWYVRQLRIRMLGAALSGCDTGNDLRSVSLGLFGVEGALATSDALTNDFGALVDEDGHYCACPALLPRLVLLVGQNEHRIKYVDGGKRLLELQKSTGDLPQWQRDPLWRVAVASTSL